MAKTKDNTKARSYATYDWNSGFVNHDSYEKAMAHSNSSLMDSPLPIKERRVYLFKLIEVREIVVDTHIIVVQVK